MKSVNVVYNTKKKKGETQYGVLFNDGLVRKRREWRGIKDTLYDFSRWLYLWYIVIDVTLSKGAVKGLFRYRWLTNYIVVPHLMDKFTIGMRDETLRITHTAMDFVIKDVASLIKYWLRGDRRCGNDVEFSNQCILSDENAMTLPLMGFPPV